jgi:hypothetical protein
MIPVIPLLLPGHTLPAVSVPAFSAAAPAARPRHAGPARDRPGVWLYAAAAGLCVLAGSAAAVSFSAQYRLVYAARHLAVVAGLEAAIPDVAALVFACLGVALALHGRRAVRARMLNAASAGASVFMNLIAAAPGWRDLAVWVMPPAAYALASDTLIGVVRTWVIARHQDAANLTGEVTLLAVAGGILLWLLRLSLAPVSTLTGFRAWVIEECPVAPGRRAASASSRTPSPPSAVPAATSSTRVASRTAAVRPPGRAPRGETKTSRFLATVAKQHGPLAAVPLGSVSRISAQVAPQVDLHPGSARAALRRAVLAAQDGAQS